MQIHCPIRARIYVLSVMSWVINNLLLFADGILLEHIYTQKDLLFSFIHTVVCSFYLFILHVYFLNVLFKKVLFALVLGLLFAYIFELIECETGSASWGF